VYPSWEENANLAKLEEDGERLLIAQEGLSSGAR